MEFLVLGPLEAREQGRQLVIGPPRIRTVLALLLCSPNTLVSVDRLVDELWPEQPPAEPRDLVHGYVSRLRRALRAASAADRLVTRRPGYLLRVDEQELDRWRFERLLTAARSAARTGALDDSLATYRQADRLWRGEPLADTSPTASTAATAAALTELRLAGQEEQYDVALRLGEGPSLVAELTEMVAAYPLRERLVGLLMEALGRTGRTADAIELFEQTRKMLAVQLSIEPGPQLRTVHQSLLRGDCRPDAVRPAAPPAQLPADLPTFTGRAAELTALLKGSRDHGLPAVIVIDGMAGVGKTALAVRASHRLAREFPDGQLFVDLHGGSDGGRPVDPEEALDRMLRALGCAGSQIPHSLPERSALYRSELARRQVLIVLDNAVSEEQVRPLLPGAGRCLVLTTSRRRLTGLDGARLLSLDVLGSVEAIGLFNRIAGETAPGDPVEQIVDMCGRLPLAVRIAAARFRARPAWTMAHLADRLRDQRTRLGELVAGRSSVAAAFGLSYGKLAADQRRVFRLLGLHPGPDLDCHAAAALADTPLSETSRLLEELVDVHLLESPRPDRYRLHDLIRAYAATAAAEDESESSRRSALTRLFDHYSGSARSATAACHPSAGRLPTRLYRASSVPGLDHPATAAEWLGRERTNLLAVAARATDGWPAHAVDLSRILFRHLDSQGLFADAERLHGHAQAAARRCGDDHGQADALRYLASVHARWGLIESARELLRQALVLYDRIDDPAGEAHVLYSLGLVSLAADQYHESLDLCRRALSNYSQLGDMLNLARTRHALGGIQARLGQYDEALEHLGIALVLHRRLGNRDGQARAAQRLGEVCRLLGRDEHALALLQQAAAVHRQTGNRDCLAATLDSLGCLYRQRHQLDLALDHLHQALDLRRRHGLCLGEAETLNNLGYTAQMAGRPDEACTHHEEALVVARGVGARYQQARAYDGLAHAYHGRSADKARHHWLVALDIHTELDVPEATKVRALLDAVEGVQATSATHLAQSPRARTDRPAKSGDEPERDGDHEPAEHRHPRAARPPTADQDT
ncbi:BTAD domain-containing putative transcriptional regulator [Kribbella sp. NPDC050820]|uniref:AfsR/SARP family transcriptional regulator n=1 Tax=Kribbella sp. NPDC050820 TaxID=3155408 RepID=UPI0033FE5C3F